MLDENDFFTGTTTVPTGNYLQGKEMLYDGKLDALASAFSQIYPVIMDKFWRLVDPEELVVPKDKGEEIRKLKVY